MMLYLKDHKDRTFIYDDNADREAKDFKAYLYDYISGEGIKRED
jgi:hypothetical protein